MKKRFKYISTGLLASTLLMSTQELQQFNSTVSAEVQLQPVNSEFRVGDYTYVVNSDLSLTLRDYSGSSQTPVIPATVEYQGHSYNVTVIGSHAFSGFTHSVKLTSIIIPEGIQEIKSSGIEDTYITEINLPSTLKKLDYKALYNDRGYLSRNGLTKVTGGSGLEQVDDQAFAGNQLVDITFLPNSATVSGGAVSNQKLTTTVNSRTVLLSELLKTNYNLSIYSETNGVTYNQFAQQFTIPAGVTSFEFRWSSQNNEYSGHYTVNVSASDSQDTTVNTDLQLIQMFPDATVRDKVIEAAALEKNKTKSEVTVDDVKALTTLNASGTQNTPLVINDLTGLNQLTNLKSLNINYIKLTVNMKKNDLPTSLVNFTANNSNITSQQISDGFNLPNLRVVNFDNNQIDSLNFLHNSEVFQNLYEVSANNNQITNINILAEPAVREKLPNWHAIQATGNHISDFSPLVGMLWVSSAGAYNQSVTINKTLIKPQNKVTQYSINNEAKSFDYQQIDGQNGTYRITNAKPANLYNLQAEGSAGYDYKLEYDNSHVIKFSSDVNNLPRKITATFSGTNIGGSIAYNLDWIDSRQSLTVKDVTLTKGQSFNNQDAFVSATDDYGNTVTFGNDITVEGTVDTQKAGSYQLTYRYGNQTKIANVTVKEPSVDTSDTDNSQNQLLNAKSQARYQTNEKAKQMTDYINKSTSLEDGQKQTVNNYIDSLKQSDLKRIDDATTFNGLRDILDQSELKTLSGDIEALIQKLIGVSGTIHYIPNYGVQNWTFNQNGQLQPLTGSYTPSNSQVKGYDTKVVDGVSYIRIGSLQSNTWVQMQYLSDSLETDMTAIATVGNTPTANYAVYLRDAKGDVTTQKVMPGTSWLVFAQKKIGGQTYYRIGNENQWIQAEYTKLD